MGLFRTLLLVVLSCAVMSVQAANFNSTASKTELEFTQCKSLSFGSSLNNELYLPAGSSEKIPVVILLH